MVMTTQTLGAKMTQGGYGEGLRAGLITVIPLTFAVGPFAMAMAVAAHAAGFNPVETVLMSGIVFAGAAQMAAISLIASGAGLLTIVLTTLLINLRHIVYGLSLDRHLPERPTPPLPILAFLLIDEAYGLTMAREKSGTRTDAFYVGVALGMYLTFVVFTGIGAVAASQIPEIDRLGLDFIFPLAFVGMLMPLLKSSTQVLAAIVSGLTTMVLIQFLDSGVAILIAIVAGAAVGSLEKREP